MEAYVTSALPLPVKVGISLHEKIVCMWLLLGLPVFSSYFEKIQSKDSILTVSTRE